MGHPDGQNYAIWRGPDFFASQNTNLTSAAPVTAQGLITNFESLKARIAPLAGGGCTVTINWYTDATQTILTEQHIWTIAVGSFLDVTIPAGGNFVKVTVTTTAAGTVQLYAVVFPTNNIVARVTYEDTHNLVGNLLFSVGAGVTTTFQMPNLVAGKGQVYVQDVTSSGKISYAVATLDQNAAVVNNIIAVANPLVISFIDFNSPDVVLALRVTNNDGVAAHNASAYMNVIDR